MHFCWKLAESRILFRMFHFGHTLVNSLTVLEDRKEEQNHFTQREIKIYNLLEISVSSWSPIASFFNVNSWKCIICYGFFSSNALEHNSIWIFTIYSQVIVNVVCSFFLLGRTPKNRNGDGRKMRNNNTQTLLHTPIYILPHISGEFNLTKRKKNIHTNKRKKNNNTNNNKQQEESKKKTFIHINKTLMKMKEMMKNDKEKQRL